MSYIFEYLNEHTFKVKERTLKKYNMLAYKKLVFSFYDELKKGNFLGDIIEENRHAISYELKVPTDSIFEKVHGEIRLHYMVYKDRNIVLLMNITPERIFKEAHDCELHTYKGVIISKTNPSKDIFKVNLFNRLEK